MGSYTYLVLYQLFSTYLVQSCVHYLYSCLFLIYYCIETSIILGCTAASYHVELRWQCYMGQRVSKAALFLMYLQFGGMHDREGVRIRSPQTFLFTPPPPPPPHPSPNRKLASNFICRNSDHHSSRNFTFNKEVHFYLNVAGLQFVS